MTKLVALTKRNIKEIVRDPLSLVFCVGFPVAMLVLMQVIFASMDLPEVPPNFQINSYAVGICVFGYTFATMFVSLLIAGDKNNEFINRINMAPISKWTYLLSYFVAMMPIVLAQTVLFFALSLLFGLEFSAKILLAIVYLVPSQIFYIALGALFGTVVKTEKQAGPLCSIAVTVTGMFGGVFMPVENLGGLTKVINLLPFAHTVDIAKGLFVDGNLACIYPHVIWVVGYTAVICLVTALLYRRKK